MTGHVCYTLCLHTAKTRIQTVPQVNDADTHTHILSQRASLHFNEDVKKKTTPKFQLNLIDHFLKWTCNLFFFWAILYSIFCLNFTIETNASKISSFP